jgi:hypothetical protein
MSTHSCSENLTYNKWLKKETKKEERKKDRKNRSPPTLRGRTNEAMTFKAIACLKKFFALTRRLW